MLQIAELDQPWRRGRVYVDAQLGEGRAQHIYNHGMFVPILGTCEQLPAQVVVLGLG